MDSIESPHAALQSPSALPYSPSPHFVRKHPRSGSEFSDDDSNNYIGIVQPGSRRNSQLDSLKYTFPDESQKLALFQLKDLPDHVVVTWLAMARSLSVGPTHNHSATAGLSESSFTDPPYPTGSLGRGILSRSRSRLFDGPNMSLSEPGTVASDDSLLQPYQAQALMNPFLAASSSYETDMIHAVTGHPKQSATSFPSDLRTQSARAGEAKFAPSVTQNDGPRSTNTNINATQARIASQLQSHSKDKVQWSCTVCQHDTFRGKQEWIRHERNQHFPRYVYYCQPDIIVRNKELYCVTCNLEHPGCNHIAKCDARACALKNLSARQFASKERFIKHLRSHELPSDCQQLDEWKRLLPEKAWGCGFCVKVFDDVEERLFHVSRHFERGMTRADWDPSRVLLSLLTLPYIAKEWVLRLNVELGVEYYGQVWPEISWSKEDAMVLQKQVTSGQESGADLAESAFNASIIGQELQQRKQRSQQLDFGFTSLDTDSSAISFHHFQT